MSKRKNKARIKDLEAQVADLTERVRTMEARPYLGPAINPSPWLPPIQPNQVWCDVQTVGGMLREHAHQ